MGVQIDAHYVRGQGHATCQDYALHTSDVAVVCDGCSNAPHSDVGARLLGHAATTADATTLADGRWLQAPERARVALGLPASSLDATCVLARREGDTIHVSMHGDGVVAAARHDGSIALVGVHYERSAPPYPSYGLDPQRAQAYANAAIGAPMFFGDALEPQRQHGALRWTFPREQWRAVLIGSDGLSSFQHHDRRPYGTRDVVEALLAFRSPRGAFVTRRLRKFVTRDATRLGIQPYDDVAVAALCWEAA